MQILRCASACGKKFCVVRKSHAVTPHRVECLLAMYSCNALQYGALPCGRMWYALLPPNSMVLQSHVLGRSWGFRVTCSAAGQCLKTVRQQCVQRRVGVQIREAQRQQPLPQTAFGKRCWLTSVVGIVRAACPLPASCLSGGRATCTSWKRL